MDDTVDVETPTTPYEECSNAEDEQVEAEEAESPKVTFTCMGLSSEACGVVTVMQATFSLQGEDGKYCREFLLSLQPVGS